MKAGFRKAIRAAIGNAVVWGVAWTGLAMVAMIGLRAVGYVPPTIGPLDMLGMAIRIGIVGGLAGAVFAGVLRLAHRGRRLSELSALRFGIGGALATGILVPTAMQLSSLLSGGGLVPWNLITDDMIYVTLFGGLAAGVSVKLAQFASRFVPDEPPVVIDEAQVLDRLGPVMDAERFERWGRRGEEAAETSAPPRRMGEP
jgi:hypothetical protein